MNPDFEQCSMFESGFCFLNLPLILGHASFSQAIHCMSLSLLQPPFHQNAFNIFPTSLIKDEGSINKLMTYEGIG
jgi:hypothetical protein